MKATYWLSLFALTGLVIGCNRDGVKPMASAPAVSTKASEKEDEEATVQKALAKLSPEDRKIAEEQRFCAVQDEERLGSMGTPVKLTLKDKPVFICCAGCKKAAEKDPDKTLARVETLKAKKGSSEEKGTAVKEK